MSFVVVVVEKLYEAGRELLTIEGAGEAQGQHEADGAGAYGLGPLRREQGGVDKSPGIALARVAGDELLRREILKVYEVPPAALYELPVGVVNRGGGIYRQAFGLAVKAPGAETADACAIGRRFPEPAVLVVCHPAQAGAGRAVKAPVRYQAGIDFVRAVVALLRKALGHERGAEHGGGPGEEYGGADEERHGLGRARRGFVFPLHVQPSSR